MIKMAIITAYVCHKIYWKRTHKERKIAWNKFFEGVK